MKENSELFFKDQMYKYSAAIFIQDHASYVTIRVLLLRDNTKMMMRRDFSIENIALRQFVSNLTKFPVLRNNILPIKTMRHTVFAEINAPGCLFFRSIKKNSKAHQDPIGFVYSPLWKITHQSPSVLCTPPFEKSPITTHRFCVLPPLKNHPSNPIGFVYSPLWKSLFLVGAYFGVGVYFGKYGAVCTSDVKCGVRLEIVQNNLLPPVPQIHGDHSAQAISIRKRRGFVGQIRVRQRSLQLRLKVQPKVR